MKEEIAFSRYGKSDVENECDRPEGGPYGKGLANEKWNFNMEAGVEGKKIEIENFRVNRGSPVKKIVGKILRCGKEKRQKKTKQEHSAGGIFRPDGAGTEDEKAPESGERERRHDRGLVVEQSEIHGGKKKCSGQDEQRVLPGRMDAQVNDDDADERDRKKRGDNCFPVKLRTGAAARSVLYGITS